ncbi:MAG: GAD domain-containing protein [Elusimicrobiota bacterium]
MKVINEVFEESNSKIIDSVVSGGGVILGEKVTGKKGFLLNNMDKAKDIAAEVEKETGIKGFISTDELPKYGITIEDRDNIKKEFDAEEEDIVIMVAGDEEKGRRAMNIIVDRLT